MNPRLASCTLLFASLLAVPASLTRAADTYKIDSVHSSVAFSALHLGITNFYGRFNEVAGDVVFDKENPAKSSVNVTVQTESIDTHNPKRDQHLKSPDFFNSKQFPAITFKSNKVEGSGDSFKVTGDFTLHGVTKPITVEFKKLGEGKGMQGEMRAGGETKFTIKRSEYGMNFMPGGVGDEITVMLSLEGVKQ